MSFVLPNQQSQNTERNKYEYNNGSRTVNVNCERASAARPPL